MKVWHPEIRAVQTLAAKGEKEEKSCFTHRWECGASLLEELSGPVEDDGRRRQRDAAAA